MAEASDLRKALLSEQQRKLGSVAQLAQTAPVLGEHATAAGALKAPGGFRRGFLNQQASLEGIPMTERPAAWRRSLVATVRQEPK